MARLGRSCAWLALFALLASTASAEGPTRPVEYNRDVRPILSENCFHCHGPDKGTRKAGLRLDNREAAVSKGAIAPRQIEESELIARIISDVAEEVMPPPESTKFLTPAQKDLLKRWVAEGAEYESHWAYEPIRRPEAPPIKVAAWGRNPVDTFILASLEEKHVAPSPEADRKTLIRRLSLDLIGLPPTPGEVAAFEQDLAPGAYERVVDRLLASPHYGERMAVPWLDLVRFADTVGYHGDQNQNVFPYRDYVIDSFNANKPFDKFTVEQLAGDLLPDPTPEQRVATAFNRLNMVTREGGAQPGEYLAKYAGDRVRTVAITWLGSTMGCAECHDHKFDPFTAKDFYRMGAFFADVEQWGVYMDYKYTPNPDLRGYSNDHPFPPEIDVASAALRLRIEKLEAQRRSTLDAARDRLDDAGRAKLAAWSSETSGFLAQHPDGWTVPAVAIESKPEALPGARVEADGIVALAGPADAKKSYQITLTPDAGWVAAIRLELVPHAASGGRFTRTRSNSVPVKLAATLESDGAAGRKLAFYRSDAAAKGATYSNGRADLNINEIWYASTADASKPQTAVYLLDRPVRVEPGTTIRINLKADVVAAIRLAVSPLGFDDPTRVAIEPALNSALTSASADRSPAQASQVADAFLIGTDADPVALDEVHRLLVERAECRGGMARVVVTKARDPRVTRVLPRGNWQDETGEVVTPGVPHFLPQPPEAGSRRLDRLDLARWITSPENPLTARVYANRVWKQFFGTGLAAVLEDVGAQGEWPSHPELLDWLAADFRDGGWDVKRLVRTIVTSSTYRQSSRLRPELREADPGNRALASQSPRRLDAEFVRDNALAIAGLLNPEQGGPSVFPFQPPGYYAAIQFPNRDYVPQTDGRQYRRGLYTHWQRTFLHPMLANFDAPSREECVAGRNQANTPQQALTLLNDPAFVEAAREFARLLLMAGPDQATTDEARLDRAFRRALARPASARERESLLKFLGARRVEARRDPDAARKLITAAVPNQIAAAPDPIEWAAWTEVARVILNLHETLTRY